MQSSDAGGSDEGEVRIDCTAIPPEDIPSDEQRERAFKRAKALRARITGPRDPQASDLRMYS